MKVSFVIPCNNEQSTIARLLSALRNALSVSGYAILKYYNLRAQPRWVLRAAELKSPAPVISCEHELFFH